MKVAISSDFFTALSKLPKAGLNKTIKMVEKFKNDPKSPGLNYEKLHFASNMHSIRVDQNYRCIVLSPDSGDVYILLWVDNHDDAYNWAKKHTCSINNETGSLQIIESQTSIEESNVLSAKKEKDEQTFFAKFSDKDLKILGVDENLLEYIRQIDNEVELDNFRKYLPEEVYEALFYLLVGDSVEDAYNYVYSQKPNNVDTNDFTKALENESSKRRFYIVQNDEELMQMLNAPLEKWRVFLHPSQRKLVEKDYNGSVKVLGGAGTGKTVAAMHRAKYLAKQLSFFENKKILFTTFTKNLSLDILENLKKICDEKTMQNIEVINLDSWVHNFLSKHGYKNEIVYDDKTKELWEKALVLKNNSLDLPDSFFKEEWQRVIQPLGINTLEEYIKASRIGRGTRLNRSQRKLIWEVFEEYRYLLSSRNYKELDDAINDAINIINSSSDILKYSAIVVDEAQDFGMRAFKLLRTLVEEDKNDLFIVGDAHQRIYGHKVVLGQCGINVRGRSKKLKLNYRTTDEIRKWAVALFNGENIDDLDEGTDSNRDYKSLYNGPKPEVKNFETFNEEVKYIQHHIENIKKLDNESKICLVVRTQKLVDMYDDYFSKNNMKTIKISRNSKDDLSCTDVRISTMHRVKGLDFDHVIIACMNKGVVPLESIEKSDEDLINKENLQKEKSLVFVAATRAKRSLLVTSHGLASEMLSSVQYSVS